MFVLTILALALGAASKETLQSLFGKKNIKCIDDAIIFNVLVFITSSVVAAVFGNLLETNLMTIVLSFFFGVTCFLFQIIYLKTMSDGPVSMTVLFSNFGMIIPIAVSILFFDEKITDNMIIGFALIAVSIILNAFGKEEKKATKKWFIFALLTFLSSGTMSAVQKVASSNISNSETTNFVSISYAVAAVFAFAVYWIRKRFMSGGRTFKFNLAAISSAVAIGAILSAVQVYLTRSIEKFGAVILYPCYNCGTIIMVFLVGLILFKEKHSLPQWVSAFLGVLAIVFLSI